nr:CRTAC1 family protein [Saprospiraceae bacterium]
MLIPPPSLLIVHTPLFFTKNTIPTVVVCTLWVLLLSGCANEQQIEKNPVSGYEQMKDSIQAIYNRTNFTKSIYENDRRVELIEAQLAQSGTPDMVFNFARELLNSGRTEDAINAIGHIFNQFPEAAEVSAQSKMFHEFLAICYLRLAEQNNCLHHHSAQSCIVPLQGKGIHVERDPALRARDKYLQILAVFPEDYQSMWLLNIAFMALGEYPDQVPGKFLIPLDIHADLNSWPNIADHLGLGVNDLSGGVATGDFNNNGYIDLIATSWGFGGRVRYFENHGSKGFIEKTRESGLHQAVGGLNIKQADFNNDGHLDFIILRGAWKPDWDWGILPNSLIRNNGDGTFSDVTFESGMYSVRPTQSAEWVDYNLDGHVDLIIANETTSNSRQPFPIELYKNKGDGTFTEIAAEKKIKLSGYFKGVVSGDFNNNGYPDIFISNLDGPNLLLQNGGTKDQRSFTNVAREANVELPHAAFPAWFFDYNQDGWEDLYVASFDPTAFLNQSGEFAKDMLGLTTDTESGKLYKNTKDGRFEDATAGAFQYSALSTMGANYGDINNSGFPDFYLGTGAPDFRAVVPNRLFENQYGEKFIDQTFEKNVGHIQKGHGIAFADFNNNGFQDIYAVMGGAFQGDVFHNTLFVNPCNPNPWIKLELIGVHSNKSGLGARIIVEGTDFENNPIVRYSKISSGASFGANPLIAHIGLEGFQQIEEVKILWPFKENREYQTYRGFDLNKSYLITETGEIDEKPANSFDYSDLTPFQLHCNT